MIGSVLRAVVALFAVSMAFAASASAQDYTGRWYGAVNWDGSEYDGADTYWDLEPNGTFTGSPNERGTWSTTTTGIVLRYTGGGNSVYTGDLVGPTTILGWMTNHDINGQFVMTRTPLGDGSSAGLSGAPVSAGAFPEGFNIEPARAVLRGDLSELISAFVWGSTPQGHQYWQDISAANRGLPDAARAAVQGWVNRFEAGEGQMTNSSGRK